MTSRPVYLLSNYSFVAPSSNGSRDTGYGQNIAVNESYMAISAIRYDLDGQSDSGVVYVYPLDANGIPLASEVVEISPSNSSPGDLFGDPVVLIGSQLVTASFTKGAGVVYVYDLSSSPPMETIVREESARWGDLYGCGFDMTIDGNYLFVGACKSDQYGEDAGIVYCYRITDSGDCEYFATIKPPFEAPNGGFGRYIEVTNDQILVGSQNSSVVHVYDLQTLDWQDSIWLGQHNPIDGFGVPIDVYDNIAVIGARDSFGGFGCAVVFQIADDGKWVYQGIIYDQSLSSRGLGITVSVEDGLIAAAPKDSIINGNVNQGSVVLYEYSQGLDGLSLDYIGTYSVDSGEPGDFFGKRLSLANDMLYVTALYDDNFNGNNAGGVYIFPLDSLI